MAALTVREGDDRLCRGRLGGGPEQGEGRFAAASGGELSRIGIDRTNAPSAAG
jgi:hypothetical protein